MTFRPIKLWGFEVLICMKMNQSGTRGGDFCLLYKSAPLWLIQHAFLFHGRVKPVFPNWIWNTKYISLEQSGTDQHKAEWSAPVWRSGADQTRPKQSCLAWEGPRHKANSQPCCFTALLLHNWAVILLNCYTVALYHNWAVCIEKSVLLYHIPIGDSCWHWNWHQRPSVDIT